MKSPRWNYVRAEELMARVDGMDACLPISRALVAQAMVHATLATAAPGLIVGESLPLDRNGAETRRATTDQL